MMRENKGIRMDEVALIFPPCVRFTWSYMISEVLIQSQKGDLEFIHREGNIAVAGATQRIQNIGVEREFNEELNGSKEEKMSIIIKT